jgi:hypothetical protein
MFKWQKKSIEQEMQNTYKLYKYSDFIYDKNIEKEISLLIREVRSSFKPSLKKENSTTDTATLLNMFPVIEELKYFYNNDVCVSVATSIALIRKTKFDLRVHSYYLEGAILRIANAWEYLFIILNQFLGVQMVVGTDLRDSIIEAKCHDIRFEKHGNGYKPIITRLPDEVVDRIKPLIKKEQKLFDISIRPRNNRFHKAVKKMYSKHNNIQYIFDIYYSDDVKELINIRHEIVHRRPIGARGSISPIDIVPVQGISFDPKGWFEFEGIDSLLKKNLYALRTSIQMLIDIVFNNDLPNLKGNENETFIVYKVECNNCNKELLINDISIDFFKNMNEKPICPYCKKRNTNIGELMEVHDQYYFNNLTSYSEFILDYI